MYVAIGNIIINCNLQNYILKYIFPFDCNEKFILKIVRVSTWQLGILPWL